MLFRSGIDAFAHGIRDLDVDDEVLALFKAHPGVVLVPNLPDRGVATDLGWLIGSLPAAEVQKLQADGPPFSSGHALRDRTSWDEFEPVSPTRLFDSRSGAAPVAGGSVVRVKVSGKAGTPTSATAASFTVHALSAARDGFVTAFPCGAATPAVASVAVNAGGSVTNHVETAIANGEVCVFVSAPMHLIVDLSGWYGPSATTEYFAITPVRAVDTRSNIGLTGGLVAKVDRPVTLAGSNGLPPAARLRAVVAQVIAVGAAAPGYLTVHPCLATVPSVSMVRYVVGSNAATSVSAPDDATGRWCVTASSAVHLVVDLSGYFA